MSRDTELVMVQIAKIGAPTSATELGQLLPSVSKSQLYSTLGNHFKAGHLIRTGMCGSYAYWLNEELRAFIKKHGTASVMCGIPNRKESKPVEVALQPVWPAAISKPLIGPVVRNALPWDGEEEAPPVIGVRYRDALRPRPLDD